MKLIVTAPGTTANIGPGYDCLGLALTLYSTFTFEPSDVLVIEGCDEAYRNADNLVIEGFAAVYRRAGKPMPPVHLTIDAGAPQSASRDEAEFLRLLRVRSLCRERLLR